MEYADLCRHKRHFAAAARFYREAIFGKAPVMTPGARYNFACAAVLASFGQGEDAGQLSDEERAQLRKQALDVLRGNLTNLDRRLMDTPNQAGPWIVERLGHWLKDRDFAGVREPDALAGLPEAERLGWQRLWADVERLQASARDKGSETKN